MIINCKHHPLNLSTPQVMGILNVTPDSFYDGGKHIDNESIINYADQLITAGAAIIDIGGYSTRPNAPFVPEEQEVSRLIPVIKLVRGLHPTVVISADTFRARVARKAIEAGADIINDISGGTMDTEMFNTVADLNVPYILMHIKGTPSTMQQQPMYDNVIDEVMCFFESRISKLNRLGVNDILLDVGFGFGKTLVHNYDLLDNLAAFKKFNLPILAGVSRKSMINKLLQIKPEEALNGTTVLNTIALLNGASVLRVHDVKPAIEAIKICNFIKIKK